MMDYRLYFRDDRRHISDAIPFRCLGDRLAISFARAQDTACEVELWNASRLVVTLPPPGAGRHALLAAARIPIGGAVVTLAELLAQIEVAPSRGTIWLPASEMGRPAFAEKATLRDRFHLRVIPSADAASEWPGPLERILLGFLSEAGPMRVRRGAR